MAAGCSAAGPLATVAWVATEATQALLTHCVETGTELWDGDFLISDLHGVRAAGVLLLPTGDGVLGAVLLGWLR